MVEIIDHIEATIHECIGDGEFVGLCRLLTDNQGAIYPATYDRSATVTPNDQHKVLVYHRLLDGELEASEELSFGRTKSMQNNQRVRMVVLVHFSEGENVIDNIINAIPDEILASDIENVDYKSIVTSDSVSLIRDRDSIWTTEWGNAYKDKYQMRYNIYAVEYSINYIRCPECVT